MRHPFEGDKLDEPDTDTECGCCFSLAMPSYNNTIMLFIPAACPDTPTPSQPEALGRGHAVASNWPGCVRQRVFDRGWVDGTERVCWGVPPLPSHTLWNLLPSDANEVVGAKRRKQHDRKIDTKKGWAGRRPAKAAHIGGPFQITAAVSVTQASALTMLDQCRQG